MLFEGKVATGEPMPILHGRGVRLVPAVAAHRARLLEILATPEVRRWWDEPDQPPEWPVDDPDEPETVRYAVLVASQGDVAVRDSADDDAGEPGVVDGDPVGLIQFAEMDVPEYRHAGIDLFLDPAMHGRGIGTAAVGLLAEFLFTERGHHRLVIDPAAGNAAAIACYTKVGFRPVGLMRQYERDVDGTGWHDGLLMDLLRDELV